MADLTVLLRVAGALLTVPTTELTGLWEPPPLPEPPLPLPVLGLPSPPSLGCGVGCEPPPELLPCDPLDPELPDEPDDRDDPLDDPPPPPLDFGAVGAGKDGGAVEFALWTTGVAATRAAAGTCRRAPACVAEAPPPWCATTGATGGEPAGGSEA
jgi:hypothetical protein